ncbi:MAG: hypothetical protein RLZZ70_798, partial [Candidatus Parcubacteria bacterium]
GLYASSIPKDVLEGKFVDLLKTFTPKEEYIKLFKATVLEVWEQRKREVVTVRNESDEQLSALKTRLARIIEMRVEGDIDRDTYIRMRGDIDNRIASLEITKNEAEIDRLDLESKINYSLQNISNLARVWQDVDVNQKIKLQNAVLPEGIVYDKGAGSFGTAPLAYLLRLFWDFPLEASTLVAGSGIEPESGGYACHYSFRYILRSSILGSGLYLYLFALAKSDTYHLVSTPSLILCIKAWLGIAMFSFCKRTKVSPNLARIPFHISVDEPC